MKVREITKHGRKRWQVEWRAGGKRFRPCFPTKKAATTFAANAHKEKINYGESWSSLDARTRAELIECLQAARAHGYTLSEACRYYEAAGPRSLPQVKLSELVVKFMAAKRAKNLRPESLRILGGTLDHFVESLSEVMASDVTADDVTKFLSNEQWGAWRRRGALIDLHNLFSWAVRAKLLASNPTAAIERPSADTETPTIFTVEQCRALLKLCRERFPGLLPWLCISLFAGLRPAEVERLEWGDIRGSMIHLSAAQTKGRARRLVTIHPTLSAWLDTCRKANGPVCPAIHTHRKQANALRAAFGVWHHDVLRKSFVSYELARTKNVQATSLEAGNSPEVIFAHYRELVTPAAAVEFWAILP